MILLKAIRSKRQMRYRPQLCVLLLLASGNRSRLERAFEGSVEPERLSPGLCDSHVGALDRFVARHDSLCVNRRKPGADKLDRQRDREAVREHQRFRAAVTGGGEQFQRPAVVGLGDALAAALMGGRRHRWTLLQVATPSRSGIIPHANARRRTQCRSRRACPWGWTSSGSYCLPSGSGR